MLMYVDPDLEPHFEYRTCEFHKKYPGEVFAGCCCMSNFGHRKKENMKSVLDGREVNYKGFPLYPIQEPQGYISRAIVGACPLCGKPIVSEDFTSAKAPTIKHTCDCHSVPVKSKSIEDTMSTK